MDKEIRDSDASPSMLPKSIRRKLLATNLLSDEITISASENKRRSHLSGKWSQEELQKVSRNSTYCIYDQSG